MGQKHSGFGIASFIMSIVVGCFCFLLFLASGIIEAATPGGINEDSFEAFILGLLVVSSLFVVMVSLGLGITGLCQKERNKIFPILGTIFSSVTFVVVSLIITASILL